MEDDVPEFASPTEEIAFWKGKAQEWKDAAINSKEELDEFQVQESVVRIGYRPLKTKCPTSY